VNVFWDSVLLKQCRRRNNASCESRCPQK